MIIEAFINFNGNCRQAVDFYAGIFGIEKPYFMTYGEMPPDPAMPVAEDIKNLIAYASLKINGSLVMFSDTPPGYPFTQGNNITLSISSQNMEEIRSLFNKLKEGGSVVMDLQETFWSNLYGSVIDKFGIPWQFSHDSGKFQS
jgi:PhnB protein